MGAPLAAMGLLLAAVIGVGALVVELGGGSKPSPYTMQATALVFEDLGVPMVAIQPEDYLTGMPYGFQELVPSDPRFVRNDGAEFEFDVLVFKSPREVDQSGILANHDPRFARQGNIVVEWTKKASEDMPLFRAALRNLRLGIRVTI